MAVFNAFHALISNDFFAIIPPKAENSCFHAVFGARRLIKMDSSRASSNSSG